MDCCRLSRDELLGNWAAVVRIVIISEGDLCDVCYIRVVEGLME